MKTKAKKTTTLTFRDGKKKVYKGTPLLVNNPEAHNSLSYIRQKMLDAITQIDTRLAGRNNSDKVHDAMQTVDVAWYKANQSGSF